MHGKFVILKYLHAVEVNGENDYYSLAKDD